MSLRWRTDNAENDASLIHLRSLTPWRDVNLFICHHYKLYHGHLTPGGLNPRSYREDRLSALTQVKECHLRDLRHSDPGISKCMHLLPKYSLWIIRIISNLRVNYYKVLLRLWCGGYKGMLHHHNFSIH